MEASPRKPGAPLVLTINGGPSSIRFAVYRADGPLARSPYGKVDRIGLSGGEPAAAFPCERIGEKVGLASLRAVGHRVVRGMDRTEPAPVTPEFLEEPRRLRTEVTTQ